MDFTQVLRGFKRRGFPKFRFRWNLRLLRTFSQNSQCVHYTRWSYVSSVSVAACPCRLQEFQSNNMYYIIFWVLRRSAWDTWFPPQMGNTISHDVSTHYCSPPFTHFHWQHSVLVTASLYRYSPSHHYCPLCNLEAWETNRFWVWGEMKARRKVSCFQVRPTVTGYECFHPWRSHYRNLIQ